MATVSNRATSKGNRILVLGTGGTISGRVTKPATGSYISGAIDIGELLENAGATGLDVRLTYEQIAAVGSQDMDHGIWRHLIDRLACAFEKADADAVVIVHGTDTIEETAFLLDLVCAHEQPIILVGATRPAASLGGDGPRNLHDAIRVAADHASVGRGCLVVHAGSIFSARSIEKAHTRSLEPFRSCPNGPLGIVAASGVRYFHPASPRRTPHFTFPRGHRPAAVDVIFVHADMDDRLVNAALVSGAAGIILAGVGNGNAPKSVLSTLRSAANTGVLVARATRVAEGYVEKNIEVSDDEAGFLVAQTLNPQKARLVLQLLLANGVKDHVEQQRTLDAAGLD